MALFLLVASSGVSVDRYFKDYFWTFHLGVLAVAAFFVAQIADAVFASRLSPATAELLSRPKSRHAQSEVSASKASTLAAFLEHNIFQAKREDLNPPKPEPTPDEAKPPEDTEAGDYSESQCEAAKLPSQLLGIFDAKNPADSVAVIRPGAGTEPEVFRVGDHLKDREIRRIVWRTVYLNFKGACELLSLEDLPKPKVAAATPAKPQNTAAPNTNLGAGVRKTGAKEWDIPRAEIDNVLSNLNQIATQARIVPSFQNGKANGFKLFAIRPNSLYSKIGIQNGDVIQRINGFELNSPDKALEIYSKLKDASNISVDLVRGGRSQSLNYNIR